MVGITCMTAAAPPAYEIARHFRGRGIPVVLGGMHPTLCPDEAIQHADAIVTGDAEGVWQKVLADVSRCLAGSTTMSNNDPWPDSSDRRVTCCQLRSMPPSTPSRPHVGARMADFCAIAAFNGRTQRQRPVEEVIAEVKDLHGRMFIFVDDNLTADPEYAKKLFTALKPLRKSSGHTVYVGNHEGF